jgi:CheY-like chemotaxis protein
MRVAHQNSSKVLVVEDDAVTRELLVQLLRMAGFDALSAGSGQQALVLLRKHRDEIGWLFTELEMPGLICGVMLADEFHRSHPSRPVLSPIRFPCSPEWWRGDEALQAEAQAPQAPREQGDQAAGNVSALRARSLFSAGVRFATASHMPVDTAQ